jgi:tripartite-type tricarboxylate transporter receptor subunit TctC
MRGPIAAVVLLTAVLAAPRAPAETVEDFYRGKRLTITVGYGPGGGYDVFARLLARHLGRFVPGNPQIIVQNMPGAGSLVAANYLYAIAPKDGTAFGLVARDMPLLGLLGHNANVQFDPRKFNWLGSSSNFSDDAYMLIVRDDAPVRSIAEMRRPIPERCSGAPPREQPAGTCRASCRRRWASTSSSSSATATAPPFSSPWNAGR